jgi:hypothetical protein
MEKLHIKKYIYHFECCSFFSLWSLFSLKSWELDKMFLRTAGSEIHKVSNENATQILSVGLILTPLYPGNGMSENKCVGKIHKKNFIRNLKKEIQHTKTENALSGNFGPLVSLVDY